MVGLMVAVEAIEYLLLQRVAGLSLSSVAEANKEAYEEAGKCCFIFIV